MRRRRMDFAQAIVKVGRGITREKKWLRQQISRRLSRLHHIELCAVNDLTATLINRRGKIGPRNRRFMTRRKP